MPIITLPDGSKKEFSENVSVYKVAESIGAGLAKAALAGKVNGNLVDVSYIITDDANLSIITGKDKDGLEIIRHSTAHILAQAAKRLYKDIQITIGPVIEDGFYYDFAYKRPFTPEDLTNLEQEMAKIIKEDLKVSRSVMSKKEAIELFKKQHENFKVEIIEDLPDSETLSFYGQGDFLDLCRGPHVPSTGKVNSKGIKLMKLAGAYWRGDSTKPMLQRIYGTAWNDKSDLDAYLHRLEEAEKRDHRKTAKKLDLFHMQDIAPGMIFWHANGWIIYRIMENYIRDKINANGYQEVKTPQLVDRKLWEASGHWDKFKQNMYTLTFEEYHHALKPMNCPCHVQIYNQGITSYKELPIRMAEFGSCHRYEASGALHGMMRLRNFVQDDAHIFCTEEQVQEEVASFIKLLFEVYKDFGFADIIIRLSTRPTERVGSDEVWDKAEDALAQALKAANLNYEVLPGEGAFYGPKIEFSLKDCIGRVWQCGTMQVDFSMPERLEATYIAVDGSKKVPVMLHRAILGAIERFIGILLEETAGSLPVWLAPIQVMLMNITVKQEPYLNNLLEKLTQAGFRAKKDLRNEKIGFKIREHTLQRVPYLLIAGDKEIENNTVSVRTREGADLGSMQLNDFLKILKDDIARLGRKRLLAPVSQE